uniref:Uncharacterized protein n=1 Tax=uncultured marine thaumarchaeote KM3_196_F10 TaxID=1456086 RepID=A0A075GYH0_9ARCH|nr:hypothetical protein [uncultured marine thaumarchaeote KM3_196_F10]
MQVQQLQQQQLKEFESVVVSTALKRSKISKENNYYWEKRLSESQKILLEIHDMTNWKDISLVQSYKTPKGIMKEIFWKLPSTQEKKETCGKFKTLGCFNVFYHPKNQALIHHTKLSCFRSACEYCWMEKWLARESRRATLRIENYQKVITQEGKTRFTNPIHVIVSPSWKDKFMRFDLLKKRCRELLSQAGVKDGLMIYHPFSLDKKNMKWICRPHFHVIGFGWVHDTKKISDENGWVIKNKGVRNSLHSTIYYQLSHAGVADHIHSITWYGDLGYRSKYAERIKVENEEPNDYCEFCGQILVNAEFRATDRGPPDVEFIGLVDHLDWCATESIEEAEERRRKSKHDDSSYRISHGFSWINLDCMKANDNANKLLKKLSV